MKRRLIPYWMAGVALLMLAPALAPGQTARMLKDISPTTSSGASPLDAPPRPLGVAGGRMLFAANDGVHGRELFVTDGTTSGTRLLLDIRPGTTSSLVGIPYFYDYVYAKGQLRPMTRPDALLARGGRVYFNADDGVHGKELWSSDGTAGGTALLLDDAAGRKNGYARMLFDGNGKLFIHTYNNCLYASDGTTSGTRWIDWWNDSTNCGAAGLFAHRGRLFLAGDHWNPYKYYYYMDSIFSIDDESDHLEQIYPITAHFKLLGVVNGALIFSEWTDVSNSYGTFFTCILHAIDLTTSKTAMLLHFCNRDPYLCFGEQAVAGGALYVCGGGPSHGRELWRTEGTTQTTHLVREINPGAASSNPAQLTPLGERLVFTATDGLAGVELWATAGTTQTTVMLGDLRPGAAGSDPVILGVVGPYVFFSAAEGVHGRELWRTDGTPEGTLLLRDINASGDSSPTLALIAGGALYFTADDGVHGRELWRSDGWPVGTRMVQDIRPGPASSGSCNFMAWGDDIFFSADDGVHGPEPWMLSAKRNAVGPGWGLYR